MRYDEIHWIYNESANNPAGTELIVFPARSSGRFTFNPLSLQILESRASSTSATTEEERISAGPIERPSFVTATSLVKKGEKRRARKNTDA